MGISRIAVAILLAAVMLIQPAQGQVITASVPIGLGFNSGTVAPLSEGIPVYTIGDQLWFQSYTSGSVDVIVTPPTGSGSVFSSVGVPGNVSVPILTFSSQDPPGLWSLTASNFTGAQTVVRFYLLGGYSPLELTGYGVGIDGAFSLNYTLENPSAYDISTCTAGNASTATAYIPIPASSGGGTLLLTLNGSSVAAFPEGNTALFTFWLGLKQDYAYETVNQTFVTRSESVAETQPVLVTAGSSGAFTTALQEVFPLATGQFTLVSNFQGSGGVSVQETSVLITGTGSWLWLRDCSGTSNPVSTNFTVSSSLQDNPSTWPRYVYVLYRQMGVSLFSVAPVDVKPASISLVAAGWDQPLTDSQVEVSGATRYSVGEGMVYLVAPSYPLQLSVNESGTYSQSVTIGQPYSSVTVQVPADQVIVQTSLGAQALSGVPVTLNNSYGTIATQRSTSGEAVFYVPPGNFTVSAVYGGQVQTVRLDAGTSPLSPPQNYVVTVQFAGGAGGAGNPAESYVLMVTLVLGVVLSGIVWALAYRRRTSTLRRPISPPRLVLE